MNRSNRSVHHKPPGLVVAPLASSSHTLSDGEIRCLCFDPRSRATPGGVQVVEKVDSRVMYLDFKVDRRSTTLHPDDDDAISLSSSCSLSLLSPSSVPFSLPLYICPMTVTPHSGQFALLGYLVVVLRPIISTCSEATDPRIYPLGLLAFYQARHVTMTLMLANTP